MRGVFDDQDTKPLWAELADRDMGTHLSPLELWLEDEDAGSAVAVDIPSSGAAALRAPNPHAHQQGAQDGRSDRPDPEPDRSVGSPLHGAPGVRIGSGSPPSSKDAA